MQNKAKKLGHSAVIMALNIFMILLCLVLVIMCIVTAKEFSSGASWYADEDAFYYGIKDENYSYVVDAYHQNAVTKYADEKELQEYYGVAKYFEAASLYHAYDTVGNVEIAQRFKAKMDAAVAEMGSWVVAKDPIDKRLGLQ